MGEFTVEKLYSLEADIVMVFSAVKFVALVLPSKLIEKSPEGRADPCVTVSTVSLIQPKSTVVVLLEHIELVQFVGWLSVSKNVLDYLFHNHFI